MFPPNSPIQTVVDGGDAPLERLGIFLAIWSICHQMGCLAAHKALVDLHRGVSWVRCATHTREREREPHTRESTQGCRNHTWMPTMSQKSRRWPRSTASNPVMQTRTFAKKGHGPALYRADRKEKGLISQPRFRDRFPHPPHAQ